MTKINSCEEIQEENKRLTEKNKKLNAEIDDLDAKLKVLLQKNDINRLKFLNGQNLDVEPPSIELDANTVSNNSSNGEEDVLNKKPAPRQILKNETEIGELLLNDVTKPPDFYGLNNIKNPSQQVKRILVPKKELKLKINIPNNGGNNKKRTNKKHKRSGSASKKGGGGCGGSRNSKKRKHKKSRKGN